MLVKQKLNHVSLFSVETGTAKLLLKIIQSKCRPKGITEVCQAFN